MSSDGSVEEVNFEDNIDIGQIAGSESGSEKSEDSNASSSGSEDTLYKEMRESPKDEVFQEQKAQQSKQDILRRKLDLLTTLSSYRERGFICQKMSMSTPLNDLEYEVHRVKKISLIKNNVEVYKKMLISGVGGVEVINRFSPKKFALNGWSNHFKNTTINECEPYLLQIAEEEGQLMDPRWMLMFTVVGSGVSYHYMQSVSTALGNALGNTLGEDIIAGLAENPDIVKNLLAKKQQKNVAGPSFDIDDVESVSIVSSSDESDFGVEEPSTPPPKAKRKYTRKKVIPGNAITI